MHPLKWDGPRTILFCFKNYSSQEGTQGAAPLLGNLYSITARNQGGLHPTRGWDQGIAEWKPLSKSWSPWELGQQGEFWPAYSASIFSIRFCYKHKAIPEALVGRFEISTSLGSIEDWWHGHIAAKCTKLKAHSWKRELIGKVIVKAVVSIFLHKTNC